MSKERAAPRAQARVWDRTQRVLQLRLECLARDLDAIVNHVVAMMTCGLARAS
ncbi:MAG: hypothetical protein HGA45_17290 [Chloroflexales bacterium]|nr:hypothetical protein [Chloroflexales bacterium]